MMPTTITNSSAGSSDGSTIQNTQQIQPQETNATRLNYDVDDNDEYCLVEDTFGCMALELHNQTTTTATKDTQDRQERLEWIRLQQGPDQSITDMTTVQIETKIRQVIKDQSTYGRADLYGRQWLEIDTDPTKITTMTTATSAAAAATTTTRSTEGLYPFSVLQFNTLAQGLSAGPTDRAPFERISSAGSLKDNYGGFASVQHPEVCLDFDRRKWRLLQVLLEASTDLLAVEEMDRFHGFFAPALAKYGYEGLFAPKLASPGIKLGWYSDGCALFWKTATFQLVQFQRRAYKVGNQVCLVVTLTHKPSNQSVVVIVTHLKAQPQKDLIRQGQVQELLELLDTYDKSLPKIILGDFNADPTSGSVQQIRRCFRSAYNLEPSQFVTTWKTRGTTTAKRIIDYIFYSDALECKKILGISSDLEPLPNLRYPSDHICIGAHFVFSGRG